MLKKFASGVLASLRDSTYRSVRLAPSLTAALPVESRVSVCRGWAGEISGLFEHPEDILVLAPIGTFQPYRWHQRSFFAAC